MASETNQNTATGKPSYVREPGGDPRISASGPSGSRNGGDIQSSDEQALHSNGTVDSDTLSPSSITIPPYWVKSNTHQRTPSNISNDSLPQGAITLRDNESSEDNDRNNACWAKSVEIIDHIVINGSATNVGAFVVWIIRVETLTVCGASTGSSPGCYWLIRETGGFSGKLHEYSKTIF
jgi:hypothetical protein